MTTKKHLESELGTTPMTTFGIVSTIDDDSIEVR